VVDRRAIHLRREQVPFTRRDQVLAIEVLRGQLRDEDVTDIRVTTCSDRLIILTGEAFHG